MFRYYRELNLALSNLLPRPKLARMHVLAAIDSAVIRIHLHIAARLGYTELQLQNLKSDLLTVACGISYCMPGVTWRVEMS